MKLHGKHALFAVVLAGLIVLFLEGTLAALSRVSPRLRALLASPWVSYTVPDPRLGHRPNPDFPGHDANGFRNPRVPDSADIVVLGDSQSYGTGVDAAQAWPSRLSILTGRTVYNMSFGGYGPAHGLFYWKGAEALARNVVLEAVYAGNDFFDSFDLVYNRGQLPELKTPDALVQERVREAERKEPLAEHVARLFVMDADVDPAEQGWTTAPASFSPAAWITRHSNLYALARRVRFEWSRPPAPDTAGTRESWESALAFARAHPDFCQPFDGGQTRTVFTSTYRLAATDLSDPRIAEGLRISLRALERANALADAAGLRFIVLIIPTKESVFEEVYTDPPESYRRLVENESLAHRTMAGFLDDHGIEYLDLLPALRAQLASGPQPYHLDYDGHPNEIGHRAIAASVAERLTAK